MSEKNQTTPAEINQKITLRLDPDHQAQPQIITTKQLDSLTRTLTVKLVKNGSVFKIPQKGFVKLRGTRADGTAFDLIPVESDFEKSVFTFAFTQSSLSVAGLIMCDLLLCYLEDETYAASTEVFYIDNLIAAVDSNAVYEEKEFQSIDAAIAKAENASEIANKAAQNANTATENINSAAERANDSANKADSAATTAAAAASSASIAAERANGAATGADSAAQLANFAAGEALNSIDFLPDYWIPALETGAESIRQAMESAGQNKSAFLFYTDSHLDNEGSYNPKFTPKILKYLCQNTPINKVVFGGDIIKTASQDRNSMKFLWEWRKNLFGVPNHHSVVGEHDDGTGIENLFGENYIYAFLQAAEETADIVREDKGLWYYIDNKCEKTRYLYLDTAYQGLTEKQETFVTNALLTTPKGWHVIPIAHVWMQRYAMPPLQQLNASASALMGIFDNYNNRQNLFADCKGWVEFCIGGHIHNDYSCYSPNGIPIIHTASDSILSLNGPTGQKGTTEEAAVTAVIADYDAKTIKLIRIGKGSNRNVNLNWRNTEI